jgi:hypothetical protein
MPFSFPQATALRPFRHPNALPRDPHARQGGIPPLGDGPQPVTVNVRLTPVNVEI